MSHPGIVHFKPHLATGSSCTACGSGRSAPETLHGTNDVQEITCRACRRTLVYELAVRDHMAGMDHPGLSVWEPRR